jgi:hypothetical protein
MIYNESACKLEIVQNIAKYFFQFVIKIKITLLCPLMDVQLNILLLRYLIKLKFAAIHLAKL